MLRATRNAFSEKLLGGANSTLRLRFSGLGAYAIPAIEKTASGGEDGFFLSRFHDAIGVADGVGGWRDSGVDPALYTRDLMRHALAAAEAPHRPAGAAPTPAASTRLDAQAIMQTAYDHNSKTHKVGSCTAAFAVLDDAPLSVEELKLPGYPSYSARAAAAGSGRGSASRRIAPAPVSRTMQMALVGDCGVCVLRHGVGVALATREQQRAFNFPMQLGDGAESPRDAVVQTFDVIPGDIVILGSDGLFDNIFPDHLPSLTISACGGSDLVDACPAGARAMFAGGRQGSMDLSELTAVDCQHLARFIAQATFDMTQETGDKAPMSPFSLRARMQGMRFDGMKPDDITVVVAQVGVVADEGVAVMAGEPAQAEKFYVNGFDAPTDSDAASKAALKRVTQLPTRKHELLTVVPPQSPSFQLIESFLAAQKAAKKASKL